MPPCPRKIARTSHGILTDHTYSSQEDGLLFELSQPANDIRCPGLHIRQTGFTDLALVEKRPNLPRLQVFQEYIMDRMNQLASNDEQTYTTLGCQERQRYFARTQ